ncbi:hypothetical protein OSB04_031452 [Centaurea solstitialis]|uniref:F-box associated beta-propeller type 3 domain-containing protein n=1 Tax=Centaurea solstitialis TaxID=347529 RepID=A0AA38SAR7_9ASTR|nr:hypothetical protein OSB04_031452 [Centaurea solstitialis]
MHKELERAFDNHAEMRVLHGQFADDIIGSCNGVICLMDASKHGSILWNPTIRWKLTVPNDRHGAAGFGFDELTNDYKVVLIHGSTRVGETFVYSLSTGTWHKSACHSPRCRCRISGYFFNGSVYWIANCVGVDTKDCCFIFDIQLPEPSWHTKQLLSIKGSLSVISVKFGFGGANHSIWKRDGSGAWSSIY